MANFCYAYGLQSAHVPSTTATDLRFIDTQYNVDPQGWIQQGATTSFVLGQGKHLVEMTVDVRNTIEGVVLCSEPEDWQILKVLQLNSDGTETELARMGGLQSYYTEIDTVEPDNTALYSMTRTQFNDKIIFVVPAGTLPFKIVVSENSSWHDSPYKAVKMEGWICIIDITPGILEAF